ncbi:alanine racemase [Candidatus Sumerlaeota bacterium]|nr:alanine racemase [Candidatus Sumerlaeota bacterium]
MSSSPGTPSPVSSCGPTAEVSSGALRRNLRALRSLLPPETEIAAVVKSDGYGHGIETVARAATREGCRFLAVSGLDEAAHLRSRGFSNDILITGPILPEEASEAVALGIHVALGNEPLARALDQAARARDTRTPVHVKLDTGMGRYGFLCEGIDLTELIDVLGGLKHLDIQGLMTHFSESELPGSEYTRRQHDLFLTVLQKMAAVGIRPRWIHAANSGGVIHFPEAAHSLVRVGIAMYGVYPGPDSAENLSAEKVELEPAMTLRCPVADIRLIGVGASISYGRRFTTHQTRRLGLLPVGYGNGYPRSASGGARVMIKGRSAPVVGAISMNVVVIDVTDHEGVEVGDSALFFGRTDQEVLRVEEVAEAAGTIPYEILCNVGRCTPRVVVDEADESSGES